MNIVSQMCAIAVMFVIMYFYISQKKIILHTSKAFAEVWIAGLLSLFFDIFALVAIEKRSGYPHTATNIICKLYLWTVTWVAMVAFWYICVDIFRKKELERKWRKRLWIFGILTDILIMVVPIKIYDSDNIVYTYGPAVIITYAVTVILLALILMLTKKYSQAINPRRRKSMQVWVALMFISAVIQFIDKKILIVSFASVIGVLILFIMLENPMANIDRDTGFFNLNALFEYMKEAYGQGNDVSIVCIRYGSNENDFFTREMEKSIFYEVVSFINKLTDNYVFRSSANEYLLVFENTDSAEKTIGILERRFDKPWGGDNMTMLFGEIYYLSLMLTKKYSQAINPRRRKSMQVWVALMFISAVIQFIDKKILIVSFASVIGVLILFIMLENPMANIDRDTGFFNLNALFEYMKEAYGQGNDVSIVCIRYGSNENDFFTREMEKSIFYEVVSFINKLTDNYVFRSSANEYLLVFENTDSAEKTIGILERRFDKPWGGDNMTMLFGEIYYLRSTELVRRPSDILGLFQYAKRNRAEFTGRGVMLINNEVIEHIYDENSVENEIIEALRDNRVEVFYQPIYNTKTHKFTSAEALVRIRSRE